MIVYTKSKIIIELEASPLAVAGAEGTVYRVRSGRIFTCAKIYHSEKQTISRKRKIELMIKNKPQFLTAPAFVICWPTEMVYDISNNFIGFLMPLAFSGSVKLYEITKLKLPRQLPQAWNKFDRATKTGIEKRFAICKNICSVIHTIHLLGNYAIVDYKPQNILLTNDGKISLTDVDSFQIVKNGTVLFHSEVATPEYAPPEAERLDPSNTLIKQTWDRFSMAISFYEIIFGIHPFTATCGGQYALATTLDEKIQKGLFVHGSKRNYLTVIPSVHENFKNLPPVLQLLFIRTFDAGHTNAAVRPRAEEWGRAINNELRNSTAIKPTP